MAQTASLVAGARRATLPAIDIVRMYAAERGRRDRELDLVAFLDGDPATGKAEEAGVDEFCASADRRSAFQK